MRKNIFTSLLALTFVAMTLCGCQTDIDGERMGYLRINASTNVNLNSVGRSRVADNYDATTLTLQVINAAGTVVKEIDNYTQGQEIEKIALAPGTYTVRASSMGFDGMESGFDIPYYVGQSEPVVVESDKIKPTEVVCTLANVKVTVNFSDDFAKYFRTATSTVSSAMSGVTPLTFEMNKNTGSGYFPVANLTALVEVVNMSGVAHSMSKEITGVKARHHYILNYKVADKGNAGFTVSTDNSETVYNFSFPVSTQSSLMLITNSKVDAWATFATVDGRITVGEDDVVDKENVKFEYSKKGTDDWQEAVAEETTDLRFSAKLVNLEPNTEYLVRMKMNDKVGDAVLFVTDEAKELYNGHFDWWSQDGKTIYPSKGSNDRFWDTSNPGTTTGAGAMVNVNPTQGTSTGTIKGMAAKLKSQYASAVGIGKFAAGSLYTGKFGKLNGTSGATLYFGQPFTARPTAIRGYFKYENGAIDYVGANTPASAGIVKNVTPDMCSIYIALTQGTVTIDNTKPQELITDWQNAPGVVAYGELPLAECVNTNGEWKTFNIRLKYNDLKQKPTHIIVVFSSSRYGDYFTGSTESTMYVDEVELVYDNEVATR